MSSYQFDNSDEQPKPAHEQPDYDNGPKYNAQPTGLKNSSFAAFLLSVLQSLAPQCSQKSAV